MLVQFSMWTFDDPHLREEMRTIRDALNSRSIEFTMDRVSTTIEGDWPVVIAAIEACHQALRKKHKRVLINITIDDDDA